jgi:hypothetical protein
VQLSKKGSTTDASGAFLKYPSFISSTKLDQLESQDSSTINYVGPLELKMKGKGHSNNGSGPNGMELQLPSIFQKQPPLASKPAIIVENLELRKRKTMAVKELENSLKKRGSEQRNQMDDLTASTDAIYPKKIGQWVPPPPKSDGINNANQRHRISQLMFQTMMNSESESPSKAMANFLDKSDSYSPIKARHFR